ncbi:Hypothetical predicted protein, partial [Paramuricea clavata]
KRKKSSRKLWQCCKRRNSGGLSTQRRLSQSSIFSTEEGWGEQACDQFERVEFTHRIPALQNGGSAPPKTTCSEQGLHDQYRSQGCLFFSTHEQTASTFPNVHLGGRTVSIHLPSLWVSTSSSIVHNAVEASSVAFASPGFEDDNLSRRHNCFEPNSGRHIKGQGLSLWLLQNLGFVTNCEKLVLQPSHTMEYLGFVINSLEMKLSLPETKMNHLVQSCRDLIQKQVSSVRTIAKVIGKLTSSMQAVFPAPLHYRHLQRLQIKGLLTGKSYETMVSLDQNCRNDLQWWIDQNSIWNGRAIIAPAPDLVITTDASMRGWGAVCQGVHTRGLWTPQEATSLHINALELKAAFFAVRAFTAKKTQLHVHLRMDNKTAITYILKMMGTRSSILLRIAQELWNYALQNQISLTAEYLPGKTNHEADWESRIIRIPAAGN